MSPELYHGLHGISNSLSPVEWHLGIQPNTKLRSISCTSFTARIIIRYHRLVTNHVFHSFKPSLCLGIILNVTIISDPLVVGKRNRLDFRVCGYHPGGSGDAVRESISFLFTPLPSIVFVMVNVEHPSKRRRSRRRSMDFGSNARLKAAFLTKLVCDDQSLWEWLFSRPPTVAGMCFLLISWFNGAQSCIYLNENLCKTVEHIEGRSLEGRKGRWSRISSSTRVCRQRAGPDRW